MLSAQFYIHYVFKHCNLLVLKIILLWEAACTTLYSQNPNAAFKIRFWVFTQGLWRAGSSEDRVIPSKLMKWGWKCPLKHQEGDEGHPLKGSELGTRLFLLLIPELKKSRMLNPPCTEACAAQTAWPDGQLSLGTFWQFSSKLMGAPPTVEYLQKCITSGSHQFCTRFSLEVCLNVASDSRSCLQSLSLSGNTLSRTFLMVYSACLLIVSNESPPSSPLLPPSLPKEKRKKEAHFYSYCAVKMA